MPLRSIADSKETNIRFTEFSHELQYSKSTVPVHRFGFLRYRKLFTLIHSSVSLRFNDCCHHSTLHMFNLFWSKYQLSSNDAEDFLYYYCIPLFWCSPNSIYSFCTIVQVQATTRDIAALLPSYYYVSPYDVIEYRRWLWRTMNKKGKNFLTTMFPFGEDTWVRKSQSLSRR